ncbi:MAG TPA: ABC transporter ATP-binding protein [Candidatus Wallbacteria bacterium]|nr:ABC transporter ATP-binding protein [Candidatus Wallbacteria bacterium]
MAAILKIERLSFQYPSNGRRERGNIFDGLSIEFERGSTVAILGPNGSGKSTFLSLMAGYLRPLEGKVFLKGNDISKMSSAEIAKLMSVVSQEHHPAFGFNAREIILMGRAPYNSFFGFAGERDYEMVERISKKVELESLLAYDYTKLSGGERKRVLLARAMVQNTPVMLFDEPEAHLDIRHQHHFLKLISELAREENKLCIYSVHNPALAMRYSTHVMLLGSRGEEIIYGPTAEVMNCRNLENVYKIGFDMMPGSDSCPLLFVKA